ncbi:unnamed protein product [Cuscuta europaea]|uniref:Uncharacterized protein n=1 Tax=Cuscuta europaea TaxID=41803 RepID=A0A9P0ZVB0_CUSEU|nr:unnamed protein product [Cuscuta europaea]
MFRDPAILAMYKSKEGETVEFDELEDKEMSGSVNNAELIVHSKEGEADGKAKVNEGVEEDTPQTSAKKTVIALDDSMKRKLEDEFSATKNGKRMRVKVKKEKD